MLNPAANRLNVYAALALGVATGFLFLKVLPLASLNLAFLFALPFIALLFLGIVLDVKKVIAGLLVVRVLLDPVLNLTKVDGGGASMGFGAVLNLFVLMLTVVLALKNREGLRRNPLVGRWALFLALSLLACAYSPAPVRAIKLFFNLASYCCMALLPFLIDPSKNDKRFWVKVLAWSTLLPVTFANLDLVRGGKSYDDAGARILGTFTHPNILAFYLVLVVALLLVVLRSGQFRLNLFTRGAILAYMANVFVLLLATKTRNAWIACWLLFLIYGILKERKFIFITLGLTALALALPDVSSRTADLSGAGSSRLNSFAWRVELWKSAWPSISERFVFGWGLATFQPMSAGFFVLERGKGADAHNTYVQMLFEGGLLGLLAYLRIYGGVLGAFFSRVRRAAGGLAREYAIVLAYALTYLLSSFADNMFYYLALNWYFWFLIGVMLKATGFHAPAPVRRHPVV